ncbi:hypothetical protein [Haliovirga abyssi]|uniref:Restriction endonuclease subunit S n=1 Tax=Haliovirga abyssi TaxID=2996794 RepID=A0AAU9E1Y1_9FUSO|nr:hypothetical protein [Haliovirga abyssi]BDU50400.1 hypothetical protein HLVA_09690 [Haliovirga abyssi]
MEGLGIKEKLFSQVFENKDFRIDSQFYTKEPIKNPLLIYDKIGNKLDKSQYGISISMNENNVGYPIYRMNEIHNLLCDLSVNKSANISEKELEIFKLNDRDVIFNRTNSFEWVGRTGIYRKLDNKDFIFASYLVRFIPDEKFILPEYLTAFLNSKQGVWDIKRRARQSINQTNVNPEEVKEIEIPLLSMIFQKRIKNLFEEAHISRVTSETLYKQAENILLEELDLKDWKPTNENIKIKSLKNSFLQSGRLDSEYYQQKYEEIIEKIKSYKGGHDTLENLCNLMDKNYKLKEKQYYKYIELSNIGTTGDVTGFTYELGEDLPNRARRRIKENDVIVSSIEGSLEKVALVTKKFDNSLCSTGFYVINSEKINSETLLILLKNKIVQQILKQNCSGTILTAINKDEFLRIGLPIIDLLIQNKIEEKIKESFDLKEKSKQLLDISKLAVEKAIEENEEIALMWIENKLKELNIKLNEV